MNLNQILADRLQVTIKQCMVRGLFQSATWAVEQLQGLKNLGESDDETSFSWNETILQREMAPIMKASCHLSMGQYIRGAHSLRPLIDTSKQSSLALFLYCYSKYLAGYKLKLQKSDRVTQKDLNKSKNAREYFDLGSSSSGNPYLSELKSLLEAKYLSDSSCDGYLLYLFAVIMKDHENQYGQPFHVDSAESSLESGSSAVSPKLLFMKSLAILPWNW